jgi:Ala-tRNA(Pro) deacylase
MTVYEGRPADGSGRLDKEIRCYDLLDGLGIQYKRADHEAAMTMEACVEVDKALGAQLCKNLLLCNRQCTDFYLLLMPGEKPFKTKYLSAQLGCARLSFANEGHMAELLHTIPGSASALELLFDTEHRVRLIIDRELLEEETVSGHPGFSTTTVKLAREDLLRYLADVGHEPTYVDLPRETAEEK